MSPRCHRGLSALGSLPVSGKPVPFRMPMISKRRLGRARANVENSKEWRGAFRRDAIRDVAARVENSPMTVSNFLNARFPKCERTRERIDHAIRFLD